MKTIYKVTYALYEESFALTVYVGNLELARTIAHKRSVEKFGEEDGHIEELIVYESLEELPLSLKRALSVGKSQHKLVLE